MNVRGFAGELVILAAPVLWAYSGAAIAVATFGDGDSLSFAAPAAVVVLSYCLARGLRQADLSDAALRSWGVVASIVLLSLVLRIEIARDAFVWELGWLADLVRDPGPTLEGRAGDVTAVVVLAALWLRGVSRGARPLIFAFVVADTGFGLAIVLAAALLAAPAGAPEALTWLVVPYMMAGLVALAVAHLRSVDADPARPFLGVWALWIGGSLSATAGLALLLALLALPSPDALGDGVALAVRGLGTAALFGLWPLFAVVGLLAEWIGSLGGGDWFAREPTDLTPIDEQPGGEGESGAWSTALRYALGSALAALLVALALAALWVAFRRSSQREDRATSEIRERVVEPAAGGQSALAQALQRLRHLAVGQRHRDAIGRLYVAMVRKAAAQGLARPVSATPLEFAGPLEQHFRSPVAGAISRAYADARYARRSPAREELDELRAAWRQIERETRQP